MTLDTHSKNVCLIGILHIIAYLVFAVDPLKDAYQKIYYPVIDEFHSSNPSDALILGAYYISMAILAALMIRGVFTKRHTLLAPFAFMSTLFLIGTIASLLNEFPLGMQIFYKERYFYKIGITTMALYPICTLYEKLRSQAEKEKGLPK